MLSVVRFKAERFGHFVIVVKSIQSPIPHGFHLWCNAPSRNYFCATEIAESKKGIFSFPLVEMLLSPKGTKPLEEF